MARARPPSRACRITRGSRLCATVAQTRSHQAERLWKAYSPASAGPCILCSESEMQPELHLAHVGSSGNLAGALDVHRAVRIGQVHVVKSVVVFPLEFQGLAFRHSENFAK